MKLKKVLAAILAATMIMGMSVTTFAEGQTADITIDGLSDDESAEISYLQVVEPDRTSELGWRFVDESDEEPQGTITSTFMEKFGVETPDEAIQALLDAVEQTNGEADPNKNIEAGDIHTNSQLNSALSSLVNLATNTTGVDNEYDTITGLESAGLYLIRVTTEDGSGYSYIPMLAYVQDEGLGSLVDVSATAKGSHNIIDKNLDPDMPGNESVSAEDEVGYVATVTYPYYSEENPEKPFVVTDTLTNGTFKADSLNVYVGDPLTEVPAQYYSVNAYANTNQLVIDFSTSADNGTNYYNSEYAGQTITIKYTAIVGEGEGDLENKIETNLDTTGDTVKSDKISVKVIKTEEDNADELLPGATFKIYEAVTEATEGYETVSDVKVQPKEGALQENQTLYLKEVDTKTTSSIDDETYGTLTFVGLDADKTYYIKETEAPEGYSLNDIYYAVGTTTKNDASSTDDVFVYNDFGDLTVEDTNLSSLPLPSTGGMGTTIFTIGGCAIMIAAAGLYFASRRKQENK